MYIFIEVCGELFEENKMKEEDLVSVYVPTKINIRANYPKIGKAITSVVCQAKIILSASQTEIKHVCRRINYTCIGLITFLSSN